MKRKRRRVKPLQSLSVDDATHYVNFYLLISIILPLTSGEIKNDDINEESEPFLRRTDANYVRQIQPAPTESKWRVKKKKKQRRELTRRKILFFLYSRTHAVERLFIAEICKYISFSFHRQQEKLKLPPVTEHERKSSWPSRNGPATDVTSFPCASKMRGSSGDSVMREKKVDGHRMVDD